MSKINVEIERMLRLDGNVLTPLSVVSIYPYFLISALLLGIGGIIARRSVFYRQLLDAEDASARFHSIDGLRGFLALGVFFHHAVISYFFYQTGQWVLPPSRFYTLLGQVGVAFFFMITAFLFWSKGLRARPFLRTQELFWSRLTRLVPLYLFSVLMVFVVALTLTDFKMLQTARTLLKESLTWASFGFIEGTELNGFQQAPIVNGVYWSLKYEWLFYLFLPLGLMLKRGRGFLLLAITASAFIYFFSNRGEEWNFLFGILAALIGEKAWVSKINWMRWPVTIVAVAAMLLLFSNFDVGYGWEQSLLIFICFVCIANGNDILGILTSRAARMLGAASYSIYLMHCILLFVALRIANQLAPVKYATAPEYWIVIALCGVAVVLASALTYRLIEHPLMKLKAPKWLRESDTSHVATPIPNSDRHTAAI